MLAAPSLCGPSVDSLHVVAPWKLDFSHSAEDAQGACSEKTQQKLRGVPLLNPWSFQAFTEATKVQGEGT